MIIKNKPIHIGDVFINVNFNNAAILNETYIVTKIDTCASDDVIVYVIGSTTPIQNLRFIRFNYLQMYCTRL